MPDRAEIAAEILRRIAAGESLRSVCRSEGMPGASTFIDWVNADTELAEQYARARDERADAVFDDLMDIADDETLLSSEQIQRAKLRIDTRKWALARMAPKKYGEKTTTELTGEGGGAIKVEFVRAKSGDD